MYLPAELDWDAQHAEQHRPVTGLLLDFETYVADQGSAGKGERTGGGADARYPASKHSVCLRWAGQGGGSQGAAALEWAGSFAGWAACLHTQEAVLNSCDIRGHQAAEFISHLAHLHAFHQFISVGCKPLSQQQQFHALRPGRGTSTA